MTVYNIFFFRLCYVVVPMNMVWFTTSKNHGMPPAFLG